MIGHLSRIFGEQLTEVKLQSLLNPFGYLQQRSQVWAIKDSAQRETDLGPSQVGAIKDLAQKGTDSGPSRVAVIKDSSQKEMDFGQGKLSDSTMVKKDDILESTQSKNTFTVPPPSSVDFPVESDVMDVDKLTISKIDQNNVSSNVFQQETPLSFKNFEPNTYFDSYDSFMTQYKKYAQDNNFQFSARMARNNKDPKIDLIKYPKSEFELVCVHFGKPRPASAKTNLSKSKRPNQSSIKLDCCNIIRVSFQRKTLNYKVTSHVSKHQNHDLTKEAYNSLSKSRKLTNEESKLFIDKYVVELNLKKSSVRQQIKKDTGKTVTTMDIFNEVAKYNKQW